MAYRKRSARPHGSSLRKRRSIRPLVENLEIRLVLSQVPLAVPTNALAGASITSLVSSSDGLVSYPLANGGTTLMLSSGDTGPLAVNGQNTSQPASGDTLSPAIAGLILAHAPVASPLPSGGTQDQIGPSGYTPQQIQSAYGVNLVSFAGIKGDGTGQTIGIYEEGYNPDFVNTYLNGNPGDGVNPAYSTSALAFFDQTFGLPDPPSLTFVDHNGVPLSSTNNSSNNPDFDNYGAGDEIALDIEWAHAMAPGASIVVLCATPDPANFYDDIPQGMATLAGLPGMSVVSSSYGVDLEYAGLGSVELAFENSYLIRPQPPPIPT